MKCTQVWKLNFLQLYPGINGECFTAWAIFRWAVVRLAKCSIKASLSELTPPPPQWVQRRMPCTASGNFRGGANHSNISTHIITYLIKYIESIKYIIQIYKIYPTSWRIKPFSYPWLTNYNVRSYGLPNFFLLIYPLKAVRMRGFLRCWYLYLS